MDFTDKVIQAVWEKGRVKSDRNPNEWRQDQCGAWLNREQYGNANSGYGWKILRVVADSGQEPDSLQPFHCGNGYDIAIGKAQCRITADRTDIAPTQRIDQPKNTSV